MPVTCRITNRESAPRVYYNTALKPVTVNPGETVTIKMNEGDFENANAISIAKCGPDVELIDGVDPRAEAVAELEHDQIAAPVRRRGRPRKVQAAA